MYRLSKEQTIVKTDGTSFPCVDGNRDYEEYKNWLAEGNTPEPAKTQEEIEAEARVARLAEIDARLAEIDMLKVRPLSEMMLAPASEFAREKLESLEAEVTQLRAERAEIL